MCPLGLADRQGAGLWEWKEEMALGHYSHEGDMSDQNTGTRGVLAFAFAFFSTTGVWQDFRSERGGGDDERSLNQMSVVGLTDDGRIVTFKARSPERTRNVGAVTGLTGTDTALIGIDFRVQDGKLYGVGNGGGVYTIDPSTAAAVFVNSLTVPLAGTFFGVDFNPAADRLRIISDTGQNLAHNVIAQRDGCQCDVDVHPAPRQPGGGPWPHRRRLYQQRSESANHRDDAVRP